MATEIEREPPANSPPEERPSPAQNRLARALALLAALGWTALAWPALTALHPVFHRAAIVALVASAALALAFAPVGRWFSRAVLALPTPVFLALASLLHLGASEAFTRAVAKGHTLSPDGAVYLFQARAMSHGSFGTPMGFPRQAFSMRFLFEGADGALHGVFPPGWPLFLAPFVRAGVPLSAGWVVSALLCVATYALARALGRADPWRDRETHELVPRVAALLPLFSLARAAETSDLLSHGFVGALGSFALALSLDAEVHSAAQNTVDPRFTRRWTLRGLAVGALLGWCFSARLLDGIAFAAVCLVAVAPRVRALWSVGARRVVVLALLASLAGALPFAALVAAHQRVATGSWTTPTQREYFRRSDWPPTCHRLGFGADVGCEVEHEPDRAEMGPAGYTPARAWRVASSRASVLGDDLLAPGHVLTLAMLLALLAPTRRASLAAAFVTGFSLLYGLFYYGNAPLFGARHLFPLAPCVAYLAARACALPGLRWPGAAAGALFTLVVGTAAGQGARWMVVPVISRQFADRHPWLRPVIDRAGRPSGIVLASDVEHAITGYDPWTDRDQRVVAQNDNAGSRELRRAHRAWPLYGPVPNGTLVRLPDPPLPDIVAIESESAWPSLQWPQGLKSSRADMEAYGPTIIASARRLLALEHATVGASVRLSFETAAEGRYRVSLIALAGPRFGDYRVSLDGAPLGTLRGYAPTVSPTAVVDPTPRVFARGRHELTLECVGRDARATDFSAALDVLVARPVE